MTIYSALILLLISCGQVTEDKPVNNSTPIPDSRPVDSVTVEHEFMINSPFNDGSEIDYFKSLMNKSTKTTIVLEKNKYEEKYIDTIKTIEWGKSSIETITIHSGKVLLRYVSIDDNNFELKNKIKVGHTAENVFHSFNVNYDKTKNYKFLELATPDTLGGISNLTFYFTHDTLTSIFYWPYLD